MSDVNPGQNPAPSPGGSAVGCALFAIGMLFAIPSGLCTAFGLFGLVTQMISDPAELARDFDSYIGFVVLTLGALAIGVALVLTGLRVRRG
jgi:hypothetical protein